MSSREPSFWKYLVYDEFGMVKGISDDAPDEEKENFKKYQEEDAEDCNKI